MEEIKQGWKKRISWLLIALTVVIVYKMLDNFSNVTEWFGTFFRILKPFFAGLLISYILFMPCKKIENALSKSKLKFVKKKARGLSVIATYIIFVLIMVIIINCIFPVLKESVVELVSNIPGYYETLVNKYKELPEDSVLKSDVIKDKMTELSNIDMKQFLSINNEKIIEYVKNIINIFSGIFDVFVSIIVSVYILLQRTAIMKFLRRFARAIFKKNTYEAVNKYFTKANEVFFTFISSQLLDAVIVGILTTVAMLIIKVKYAPLIGFTIGLFNMIPYIGAIVAVGIGILITFLGIWELLANNNIIDSFITSQPSRIWKTLTNLGANDLIKHIQVTTYETVVGFLLGTGMGIIIAIILWWSGFLAKVSEPYLVVLNSLPKVALRTNNNYMGTEQEHQQL